MTLQEIKDSDKVFLKPDDIAPLMKVKAQLIRDVAQTEPDKLGFPISRIASKTLIPRKAFLIWLGET